MSINPALLIAGPAIVQHKNKTFYSKGNITVTPVRTTFAIETSRFGEIEQREDAFTYEVKFTPAGRLDALAVLWPFGGAALEGALIHAVAAITAVDIATEIVTFDSLARFRDGASVRLAVSGTAPGGLTANNRYFLRKLSATTGTFHPTAADALAGTAAINLTAAGSGTRRIIEEEELVVHSFSGDKYTFHNASVVAQPDLNLSAVQTAIGEATFECFRKFSTAPTTVDAFYTKTSAAVADTSFNPSEIVTEAYALAWGASAPWASLATKDGIRASFGVTLEPWGNDASGVLTRKITARTATLRARPIGIDADDIYAKLVPQGAGAGRGRRITSGDNLVATGSALTLTLHGAILTGPGAVNYDAKEERASEIEWSAQRTITSGEAGALFTVAATS